MNAIVKNGTPVYGEPLCDTCVHAHLMKGFRESEKVVICQACYRERSVPFPVRECSGYTEVKRQTLKQMEEIAWIVTPRGSKRQAGFVAPPEIRKEEIELIINEKE